MKCSLLIISQNKMLTAHFFLEMRGSKTNDDIMLYFFIYVFAVGTWVHLILHDDLHRS
jgi:hypothetical protein